MNLSISLPGRKLSLFKDRSNKDEFLTPHEELQDEFYESKIVKHFKVPQQENSHEYRL